jgi:hypothetical protein
VCAQALPSFAASNKEICTQFFPDKLKTNIIKEHPGKSVELTKYVNTQVADLDGIGSTNYLVCVYFDHAHGSVRLIRTDSNGPALAAETSNVDYYGIRGGAQLIDLDGDKKPEIIVGFMGFRGNESNWIFKWTGSKLQLMSPQSDGLTALGPIEFLDLTGDGKLSIVTQEPIRPTRDDDGNALSVPTAAYVLTPGGLSLSENFLYQGQFKRKAGPPKERVSNFTIEDTSRNYVLKVTDLNMSKPDFGPLNSSTEITLNGVQVITSNMFKPGTRNKVISIPIQVKPSNEIMVKMAGAPGSKILVTISQKSP